MWELSHELTQASNVKVSLTCRESILRPYLPHPHSLSYVPAELMSVAE